MCRVRDKLWSFAFKQHFRLLREIGRKIKNSETKRNNRRTNKLVCFIGLPFVRFAVVCCWRKFRYLRFGSARAQTHTNLWTFNFIVVIEFQLFVPLDDAEWFGSSFKFHQTNELNEDASIDVLSRVVSCDKLKSTDDDEDNNSIEYNAKCQNEFIVHCFVTLDNVQQQRCDQICL